MNIFDLQKNLEEKRLILGKKFEEFLKKNSNKLLGFFGNHLRNYFNSPYFTFLTCFLIILGSIFLRSAQDIGPLIALDFESAKINSGSVNFLTIISLFLEKLLPLNHLIIFSFLTDLVGIISLYFSYKILKKLPNKDFAKILLITFCLVYFIRLITLQYNDYEANISLLLAFLFPLLSYQFYPKNNYKIFINLLFIGLISIYLMFYFKFNISNFNENFSLFKQTIFVIFCFLSISFFYIKDKKLLYPLFITQIAVILIAYFSLTDFYHKFSLILSFFCIIFITTAYFLLKDNRIDNWPKLAPLLIIGVIMQFEVESSLALSLNLCCFWWIILFFHKKYNFFLIILAFLTIFLIFFDQKGQISWFISAVIFLSLLWQNSFKNKDAAKLTIIQSFAFFTIALYLLTLFILSIFNQQDSYAYSFRSPNINSEKKAYYINKYAKQDKVLILSKNIAEIYPLLSYLNKENALSYPQIQALYNNIDHEENVNALDKLKEKIAKEDIKLIFIEKAYNSLHKCNVDLLEYYFRDKDFKKAFLKNYRYHDTLTRTKAGKVSFDVNKEQQNILDKESGKFEKIISQMEVYIKI